MLTPWYHINVKHHLSELLFVPHRSDLNRSGSLYKRNALYLRKQGEATAHSSCFSEGYISVCLTVISASCWSVSSHWVGEVLHQTRINLLFNFFLFIVPPLLHLEMAILFSLYSVISYILVLGVNKNRENPFKQLHMGKKNKL